MARQTLQPEYHRPFSAQVKSFTGRWIGVRLDLGLRRHDKRKCRTLFHLSYNLREDRWADTAHFRDLGGSKGLLGARWAAVEPELQDWLHREAASLNKLTRAQRKELLAPKTRKGKKS